MKTFLHIHLSHPTFLNKGISKGMADCGWTEEVIDWQKYKAILGVTRLRELIISRAQRYKPDLIFVQVQTKGILDVQTVQELMKVAPVCFFNIDCRVPEEMGWFYDLTKHATHSFVSNGSDIEQMQVRNILNCSVLQSSADRDEYYNTVKPENGLISVGRLAFDYAHRSKRLPCPEIVFIGNKSSKYPNSQQRTNMVEALQKEFGDSFGVFGLGWGKEGYISVERERELYSNCKLAITQSQFNYEGYRSDRVWRALYSGAPIIIDRNWEPTYISTETFIKDVKHLVWCYDQKNFQYDEFVKGHEIMRKENSYEARIRQMEQVLESNYGLKF